MTNRQWVMWKLIDMSDEELLRKFPGFVCDVCDEYITPHQMLCKGDCHIGLDWLKAEHKEG